MNSNIAALITEATNQIINLKEYKATAEAYKATAEAKITELEATIAAIPVVDPAPDFTAEITALQDAVNK